MVNFYMEYSEERALRTAQHKPTNWFRYVDDVFVAWPHEDELKKFVIPWQYPEFTAISGCVSELASGWNTGPHII